MESLTTLLSQYSLESIIIFIVLLIVAFKFVSESVDWLWQKVKKQVTQKNCEQGKIEEIDHYFQKIDKNFDRIYKRFDSIDEQAEKTNERLSFIEERQQENTRSYLIDAHHKFCYEIKAIDDINLQSMERRYMYYKTQGGNSFIDELMEEVRKLPHVNLSHLLSEVNLENTTGEGGHNQ